MVRSILIELFNTFGPLLRRLEFTCQLIQKDYCSYQAYNRLLLLVKHAFPNNGNAWYETKSMDCSTGYKRCMSFQFYRQAIQTRYSKNVGFGENKIHTLPYPPL